MKLASAVFASIMLFAGVASADPGKHPQRAQIRQMLLGRFDRDHDGRLERGEKRHAIHALRRVARQLARSERGPRHHMKRVIERYDLDGDGNVGPRELPPGMANRLRPLDRNGDGWVNDADFGPRR